MRVPLLARTEQSEARNAALKIKIEMKCVYGVGVSSVVRWLLPLYW
jgi:hypothetical protein